MKPTPKKCDRCRRVELPADPTARDHGTVLRWVKEARLDSQGAALKDKPRWLCSECAAIEAIQFLAEVVSGPVVEPFPTLTPDSFRGMRCRDSRPWTEGGHCRCDVCTWEDRYRPRVEAWAMAQSIRPRMRSELPTFDHVLVAWAERTSYRSAAGALMARARDEAAPPERRADPWAVRRADSALEVDRSFRWASLPDRNRYSLVTALCERGLRLSVIGGPIATAFDPIADVYASVARAAVKDGDDVQAARARAEDAAAESVESAGMTESVDRLGRAIRRIRSAMHIDLSARDVVREPRGARDRALVWDRVSELRTDATIRRAG